MVDAPTDPPSKAILARQAAWAFAACSLAIGSFLEISKCNHFVHRELSELVLAAVLEALAVFSLMRSVAAARGPFGFLATICSLRTTSLCMFATDVSRSSCWRFICASRCTS